MRTSGLQETDVTARGQARGMIMSARSWRRGTGARRKAPASRTPPSKRRLRRSPRAASPGTTAATTARTGAATSPAPRWRASPRAKPSVRVTPGRLSALSVLRRASVCMGLLCGRAGRLTAQHGGFRRGQARRGATAAGAQAPITRVAAAAVGPPLRPRWRRLRCGGKHLTPPYNPPYNPPHNKRW